MTEETSLLDNETTTYEIVDYLMKIVGPYFDGNWLHPLGFTAKDVGSQFIIRLEEWVSDENEKKVDEYLLKKGFVKKPWFVGEYYTFKREKEGLQ